ncbi:MAG: hypothetical protein L3J77_02395 [Thermoplasmata archaeon]|nr:hypothetical protein [Thermoplasmata archaeon]
MPDEHAKEWGSCAFCGEAFPPTAPSCPTCGASLAVRPGAVAALPKRKRQWYGLVRSLRLLIVVVVILGLGWATLSAALTGPPTYTDPLTTAGWHTVGAGNYTYLSGAISGEDYIAGNYTVENPPGAPLTFEVFNSTSFAAFATHSAAQPILIVNSSSTRIVFAAPYTDTFYLVFVNNFAPSTNINLQVFVTTNYESNVVLD